MSMGLGKNRRRHEIEEFLNDDVVGLFEPGVDIEGKMKVATGMIRLNTHYKGEIESEGTIVVAEQGDVEADIRAKLLSVSGKVKGNVHATDRLEIKEHGIVLGDIFTASLVIDPGGYFDGTCHMPTPEPERHPTAGLDTKDHS
jgi:cytoskeletal protein CcmA (bactofilin family)